MSVASSSTIYVGNLAPHLDETTLSQYFIPFGDITSISVPSINTPQGKRNKGFGFITFTNEDEALDALDNMHLNAIAGRTISVKLADPKKVRDGGEARKGGRAVWDNEEWLKTYAANDQDPSSAAQNNSEQANGSAQITT